MKKALIVISILLGIFVLGSLNPQKVLAGCTVGTIECESTDRVKKCEACSGNTCTSWETGIYAPGNCGGGGGGGSKSGCDGSCNPNNGNNDCQGGLTCRPNAHPGCWGAPCEPQQPTSPPCNANNWGGWGACSAACGGGIQSRTNACGTAQSQACNTQACAVPTATPIPTVTPIPPTATPAPVATATPIPPTVTPRPGCLKKIQGDADCDDIVNLKDYFYYVTKKAGVTLPTTVNVDFDGNGAVDANDRTIVIKTLKP